MIHLFLGEDGPEKERKISELKTECFGDSDAGQLDFDSLNAVKLDPALLKKSLIALPAMSSKRVVLLRSCEKLTLQNKKIILEFIPTDHKYVVLILDSSELSVKNKFFDELNRAAKVVRFGGAVKQENVFTLTRALENRNLPTALKMLDHLLEKGDHPLQIMGGIVWFWGKMKPRLSADGFKKGLLVLQEADLDIKRSRLKPRYAVEIAVTKLGSIIAC